MSILSVRHTSVLSGLCLVALLGLACEAPSTGAGGLQKNDAPGSVGDRGYDAFGTGTDFRFPTYDGGPQDDGGNRNREFGEICADNRDCASGFCVPFENRNVCSERCLDEGCPAGWGCHAVGNTAPDVVFICFPPGNRLCGGCAQDVDCPNGRCFGLDGVNVCGLDCENDATCPGDYACKSVFEDPLAPKQCVPKVETCSCDEDRGGEVRVCERESAMGTCFGRETCDPAQGWVGCNAPDAVAETCNQADDDCNGLTDDVPGLGGPCERGTEIEGQMLACVGRLICTREQVEPVCTATTPVAESCNFLDDDCDGNTDEGELFADVGSICDVGAGSCRRVGVIECADDGTEARCNAIEGAPVDEVCDSQDNDCDDSVDETFPGLNEPCFNGVGACRRASALRCNADGSATECQAVPGQPVAETCDGIDNNCDGTNDEGFDDLFEPCEAGIGSCRRQGFLYCTDDALAVACTAIPSVPSPERCNGVDDDCNGITDEGYDGLNTPCSHGQGLCTRAGINVCSGDGVAVECNAPRSEPNDERCDGLDNDCDGAVDETFVGLDTICTQGQGACQRVGIVTCSPNGQAVECSARAALPMAELCNGLDDDCDLTTDEDFPDLADPCQAGLGACLDFGVIRCSADGLQATCDAVADDAADELCDNLDNDCDGTTDEDFDGLIEPCVSGEGACLRPGVTTCSDDGAEVVCNALAGDPVPEVCNGIDDNCDGRIDETFPALLRPCQAGRGECLRTGIILCSADGASAVCNAVADAPGVEICDLRDNNCNGSTDEGFVGLNTACSTGTGACNRAGVRVCSADSAAVVCDAVAGAPVVERCNAIDDNCNGSTDEGFIGIGRVCEVGQGQCSRTGVQVCADDGGSVICNADVGLAAAEICDGADNDCDGRSDEGFLNIGVVCSVGVGACVRNGINLCSADGATVACTAVAAAPGVEVCNGVDDNCNGSTDEGFLNLGQVCNVGIGYCAQSGVNVCAADGASVVCNQQPRAPRNETCNAVDDNCNGSTDEGFANLGTACSAGRGVCLRNGVNVCSGDGASVGCNVVAGLPLAAELCNAQDDDCDSRTDESFGNLGTACLDGQGACQRAGVNVCAGNGLAVTCNAVRGNAVAELCNGIDDDCDSNTDETFVDLNTACSAGVGACLRNGVRRCSNDALSTTCNAVAGAPAAEICDTIDNSCNGQTDELHPTLGQACTAGQGVCRRSGVFTCNAANRAGAVLCDAPIVGPVSAIESCDYQDDNCNGASDEGFVDGMGRYNTLANCGSCGNDCNSEWGGNPAAFGVNPNCAVVNNVARCGYTCRIGYQDGDRIPNNGCELVIDNLAIYVSTPQNGGSDVGACGAYNAPCATITNGLARAVAAVRPRVLVSDGVYNETVTLQNGISLLGGHHRLTWLRNPALNLTIINGTAAVGVHRKTIIAVGPFPAATTLDGFIINGQSVATEGNSYAVYIRDANNRLRIANNRILAGDGGRGVNGANGGSGAIGALGTNGAASFHTTLQCNPDPGAAFIRSPGGAGAAQACGAVSANGGNGGGAKCPLLERQEGNGIIGQTAPRGGAGGAGGWGIFGQSDPGGGRTCIVSNSGPADASPGVSGLNGGDGNGGGAAANNLGVIVQNEWRGASGTAGVGGVAGGGGGGGGSGAGVVDARNLNNISWDIGATGGGAGSGGCNGTAGSGAAGGGASFAIFVVFTGLGPAVAADLPALVSNELYRGLGGQGGDGGNGGAGGEGGDGGNGGLRGGGLSFDFCSFQGGKGGKGGRGGHGGAGGGANGGVSFDVYLHNDNGIAQNYLADNLFGIANLTATGGARGEGGGALTAAGLGVAGNLGQSGNLGRQP